MRPAKFKSILLPPTTVPVSPKNGEIYHDATLNQIRVNIDGVWSSFGAGTNGKEVEFQKNATHIQWRYVGDLSWADLISLSEITGPQGIEGQAGAQGLKGDTGAIGPQGPKGDTGVVSTLTIGNGLSGSSFDGNSAVTIARDNSKYSEVDYSVRVTMGSSVLNGINGMTSATSGTIASAAFNGSTSIGKIPHITCTTTSTAGSTTGIRSQVSYFSVGGGFRYKTTFMINDATTVSGARLFCGMSNTTAAPAINSSTDNNPFIASLINYFAIGYDGARGDSKLYLFCNGSTTNNATKITLNNNYSIVPGADIYNVEFFNEPNSTTVHYSIRGLLSNTSEIGTISINLPSGVLLYGHSARSNGTSAAVVKLEQTSLQLFSYG